MSSLPVRARNTAPDSSNRIHADAVARRYGFRGGLVPGVTAYAYLTRPVVARWGAAWLERGGAAVRFLKPVYDGDELTAELEENGEARLRGPDGEVCVAGRVASPGEPAAAEAPVAELEPVVAELSEAAARGYLEQVGESLPLYAAERLAHPGWLLSLANDWLIANVRPAGPWLHVESDVRHLSAVRWGESVTVRGRVAGRYEKRGHRFCDLDLLLTAGGERPAARIRHRAIYELRPPAAG